MGKTSDSTKEGNAILSMRSGPLHTSRHLLVDNDDGGDDTPEVLSLDLPPHYDDATDGAAAATDAGAPFLPLSLAADLTSSATDTSIPYYKKDGNTGTEYFVDARLDTDPALLERHIRHWAAAPPRVSLCVKGTHRTSRCKSDGEMELSQVVDFRVSVDVTPHLFRDAAHRVSWRELRTAAPEERVRRGTVLRKRATKRRRNIELGMSAAEGERGWATLQEWCHRYCASHAGLRCFRLEKTVEGFDMRRVRDKLLALVRSTNYHGTVTVSFDSTDHVSEVYNDCRTTAWRLTGCLYWVCILTLTFLLTWPYLYLRTKRFEVVTAVWPFSRTRGDGSREFVSISEDQWYNLWGRAIHRAVLSKSHRTLDQRDLLSAVPAEASFDNSVLNGAVASVGVVNELNRQMGWGYNE